MGNCPHTDEPQNGETQKRKEVKMNNEIKIEIGAVKKNLSKLPKVEAASIHVAGNKGKVSDGVLEASAFVIMVKANGEWRPENEWLHRAGMKTARRVYTDIEKAREAKAEIKKWGMPTSTKGKKNEEDKAKAVKEATEAAVGKIVAALKAMGLSEEAVKAIVAKAN